MSAAVEPTLTIVRPTPFKVVKAGTFLTGRCTNPPEGAQIWGWVTQFRKSGPVTTTILRNRPFPAWKLGPFRYSGGKKRNRNLRPGFAIFTAALTQPLIGTAGGSVDLQIPILSVSVAAIVANPNRPEKKKKKKKAKDQVLPIQLPGEDSPGVRNPDHTENLGPDGYAVPPAFSAYGEVNPDEIWVEAQVYDSGNTIKKSEVERVQGSGGGWCVPDFYAKDGGGARLGNGNYILRSWPDGQPNNFHSTSFSIDDTAEGDTEC